MEKDFFDACRNSDYSKLIDYIEDGIDVNVEIDRKRVIGICAEKGDLIMMKYLIERGAEYDYDNNQPLRYASMNNRVNVVEYLLNYSFNREILVMVMLISLHSDSIGVFEYMIGRYYGGSILEYVYRGGYMVLMENFIMEDYESAFCAAADYGILDVLDYLLKMGFDVNLREGCALINSCFYGHFDCVKYLVENGAKLDYKNYECLVAATNFGYNEIVYYLVERGADVNAGRGSAIGNVINNDNFEMLKFMEGRGGNIVNKLYLETAVRVGNLEMVKYLIEKGNNVHEDNDYIFVTACQEGKICIVIYLIEMGVNVNVRNSEALCYSCYMGNYDVVRLLIERGVNVNGNHGLGFIDSCMEGYLGIVRMLVEAGLKLGEYGQKGLSMAVSHGKVDVVKYLVEMGVGINVEMLEIAILMGYYYLVRYLVRVGGKLDDLSEEMMVRYREMDGRYKVGDLNFRGDVCPISCEDFEEGDEKLGCDRCLRVFRRDLLEQWLMVNGRCPFRCEGSTYYIVK